MNHKDSKECNSLHAAAEEGHKDTVLALLQAGATVDTKNKNGDTPLAVAKREGHRKVEALLLQHGAK